MPRHREAASSTSEFSRTKKHLKKKVVKKKWPVNLLRLKQRIARNQQVNKTPRKIKKRKPDFERSEHDALVHTTEMELKKILSECELLSDIPYDCTPDELLGEIAIANGHATTIYILRDGLSTLTVVLPQQNPTIANLKRTIEATARAQLKRELRQRHEERLKRRQEINARTMSGATNSDNDCKDDNNDDDEQQSVKVLETMRNTGELVCSITRNGHQHRSNVSWRFLWRAYALFNVNTNLPLNDENGRLLLSECGIENAATLKFCHREKYFGRKRQT